MCGNFRIGWPSDTVERVYPRLEPPPHSIFAVSRVTKSALIALSDSLWWDLDAWELTSQGHSSHLHCTIYWHSINWPRSKPGSNLWPRTSAVTIFYLVCVASIMILASIFPISIFRFNTFDFRQTLVPISIFDFSFSVFPIFGFDIWILIVWPRRGEQVT